MVFRSCHDFRNARIISMPGTHNLTQIRGTEKGNNKKSSTGTHMLAGTLQSLFRPNALGISKLTIYCLHCLGAFGPA